MLRHPVLLNAEIIRILTMLIQTSGSVGKVLQPQDDGSIVLSAGSNVLFQIDPTALLLLGQHDVSAKLRPSRPSRNHSTIGDGELQAFFDALSGSIVRLNHLGISYNCTSIDKEIAAHVAMLQGSGLHVYQEPAVLEHERWFFVGDRTKWEQPLFELVLSESKQPYTNEWVPHFQIDLDTTLSIEQLRAITDKYIGKGFFKWLFDIKDYGVVLGTGKLADSNGSKIYMALGTNLRGTEWHRTQGLKDYPG